jgi:hypothetical protein
MAEQLPLEQIIAPVFSAMYWLLYLQIGRDLFPSIPSTSYSTYQDQLVANRATALIEIGRRHFLTLMPPATPPPDDQRRPESTA